MNQYFNNQTIPPASTTFYIKSNITQQIAVSEFFSHVKFLFHPKQGSNNTEHKNRINEEKEQKKQVQIDSAVSVHRKYAELFQNQYNLTEWYRKYAKTNPNEYINNNPNFYQMSNCNKMMNFGSWQASTLNISGIRRLNGVITNHPFSEGEIRFDRGKVKFNGTWVNNFCEIPDITEKYKNKCFGENDIPTKILVLGDSRARQLTRAIQVYLTNASDFLDPHDGASLLKLDFNIPSPEENKINLMYRWSLKLNHSFKLLVCQLDLIFSEIDKDPDQPMMVIISEHLLHPIQHCWDKDCLVEASDFESWVAKNVVEPFEDEYLFKMVKYLKNYPKLQIIFTAAAYRVYNSKPHFPKYERIESWYRNLIGVGLVDQYNNQLSKIILKASLENNLVDRLKWLGVANGVTIAPESFQYIPLLSDGTHLATRNEVGGLVDSHKILVKIILNSFCGDKITANSKNSCCVKNEN